MKKTYMVAISKRFYIDATVYYEAVASNASDAVKQAKSDYKKNAEKYEPAFQDELRTVFQLDGISNSEKPEFFSVGRASQFHSEHECELCQKVSKRKVA